MCGGMDFLQGAGAGVGAFGAYRNAQMQQGNLNYDAGVASNNAKIAELEAQSALTRGAIDVNNIQLRAAQLEGSQRAAMGANNVDMGEGSPNEVLATTKYMEGRDIATATDNMNKQAWGYRVQSADYTANANALRQGASNISPGVAVGTSLLNSAAGAAPGWYKLGKLTEAKK